MHTTTATYLHSHYSPNSQVARVTFQVEEIFKFVEWQFMMIEAQIGDKKIKKPYSIASTSLQMQESKQISFVIKKASEYGMSHYLTQDITPGDQLQIKGPVWHYTDSLTHPNYLFIATGSGLLPSTDKKILLTSYISLVRLPLLAERLGEGWGEGTTSPDVSNLPSP